MTPTTRIHALFLVLILAVAGVACGSSEPAPPAGGSGAPAGATTPMAPPAAPATPVAHDGRPVEITGDDTMKFSLTEIRVKSGERVSVTLVNKGKTPKFSMGHNWIVLVPGADVTAFVTAAAEAPTTDYVPAARRAEILAATKLLGPAEQDTVTFNAPTAPGRYEYFCSFPGHFQVGMRGVLIVE